MFVSQIQALIATYGYWAVFLIIAGESAGIPLPGETVLVSAAIYAGAQGGLDIRVVIALAASAAIIGDNCGYWVGRKFGVALLLRHGSMVGIDEKRIKLGQYLFLRYGGAIVFFGRFVAVLRAFAALLAGVNRYAWPHFLAFNCMGGICWAMIFGFGGYAFGDSMHRVAGPVGFIALALALTGMVLSWRFFRHHEARLQAEAERAFPSAVTALPH